MEIIGIDIGFGFTKATNGKDFLAFKSIFGDPADIQYRENLLNGSGPEEHLHLEFDGHSVFVGELAEKHSQVRSFTLDQDHFITAFVQTMAYAALAHLTETHVPVNLVTGLPIAHYRRHKDEIADILKGKHEITLYNAAGEGRKIMLSVNQVRVIPQPFGTLFDCMFNDFAEVGVWRYAREKIGIIDIGFRTADYTIADKTRYSARGSSTTDCGISQAFGQIADKLKESTGVDVEIYRLYEAVDNGQIKIRGKLIDLKPITEQVFRQLASSIAQDVEKLWRDDWDIDLTVVTGGGGTALAPYLAPLLPGELITDDTSKDSRLNNVRGYLKYGRHLWNRGKKPPAAAE